MLWGQWVLAFFLLMDREGEGSGKRDKRARKGSEGISRTGKPEAGFRRRRALL